MDISELRQKIDGYRSKLADRPKRPIVTSNSGPIGISPIDWILEALEVQDKRIAELEKKLAEK